MVQGSMKIQNIKQIKLRSVSPYVTKCKSYFVFHNLFVNCLSHFVHETFSFKLCLSVKVYLSVTLCLSHFVSHTLYVTFCPSHLVCNTFSFTLFFVITCGHEEHNSTHGKDGVYKRQDVLNCYHITDDVKLTDVFL